MVLVCLIVIAALAACVISAWRRAGAAPSPAARPAERRAARVIVAEEGFTSGSIEYGRSVTDHPMLEREAAKLCEKMEADIRNGATFVSCEIDADEGYLTYSKRRADEEERVSYYSDGFPTKEHWGVKGHDQVLGVAWALQHLALAKLRSEMPEVTHTMAYIDTDRDTWIECVVLASVRK